MLNAQIKTYDNFSHFDLNNDEDQTIYSLLKKVREYNESSISNAYKAIKYSDSTGNKKHLIHSYYELTTALNKKYELDSSNLYIDKALALIPKEGTINSRDTFFYNTYSGLIKQTKALNLYKDKKYFSAFNVFEEASESFKKNGDSIRIYNVLRNKSKILRKIKAKDRLKAALNKIKDFYVRNELTETEGYANYLYKYTTSEMYRYGIVSYKDSLIKGYKKVIDLAKKNENGRRLIISSHTSLSLIYRVHKDYDKALKHIDSSYQLIPKNNSFYYYDLCYNLNHKGYIYSRIGDKPKYLEYLLKTHKLSQLLPNNKNLNNIKYSVAKNLFHLYNEKKDYKSAAIYSSYAFKNPEISYDEEFYNLIKNNFDDQLTEITKQEEEKLKQYKRKRNLIIYSIIIICLSIFSIYAYITKQKLRHSFKNEQEANNVKSVFLSKVSHEMKTPLNAIIGFSDILMSNDEDNNENIDYYKSINDGGQKLLHIVKNLLHFSNTNSVDQKFSLQISKFKLLTTIEKIVEFIKPQLTKKDLKLSINIDDSIKNLTLKGNKDALVHVLNCTLDNAIKFSEKGTIRLDIEKIKHLNEHLTLLFKINDQGIGIAKQNHNKIFEKFYQVDSSLNRDYDGMGLGLSTSKDILNHLNSDINVSSSLGKGSEFSFSLKFEIC